MGQYKSNKVKVVMNDSFSKGYGVKIVRTRDEKIELAKKICNLISTGKYSLEACCDHFAIRSALFHLWARPGLEIVKMIVDGEVLPKGCIPEIHSMYKEALDGAKGMYRADLRDKARRGLMAKVEGVEWEEVTEEQKIDEERYLEDGEPNPTYGQLITVKRTVKKGKNAPDTTALIFALTNVDSDPTSDSMGFKSTNYNKNANTFELPMNGLEHNTLEELQDKRRKLELKLLKTSQPEEKEIPEVDEGEFEDAEEIFD